MRDRLSVRSVYYSCRRSTGYIDSLKPDRLWLYCMPYAAAVCRDSVVSY